ncbi:hypothetical protein EDB85DRAFT_2019580 [Lactarius pseudohatsudake]|nr:hypothetical protein EDB85DRAFT_2019580 [Lactarius pseudohatsudake]
MVPCLAHISYLMITACLTSPSVTGSRPDRQRSAVSPLPTITTPRILSSFVDNLRAARPTPSYLLLSPPGNMIFGVIDVPCSWILLSS